MTQIERKVRAAQHRLWFNRWLDCGTWCLLGAAAAFAIGVLVQRLYALDWPVWTIAGVLTALAFAASLIWTVIHRESPDVAAARLDQAAGLRERISSGRYCQGTDDPFAAAVVVDAERVSSAITPSKHIRLTVPRPLGATVCTIALAALMFLIRPGLLKKDEAAQTAASPVVQQEVKLAVKKQMDQVREMVQTNPALEDLEQNLEELSKEPAGQLHKPQDLRHDAIKKIDNLADAMKQRLEDDKYDAAADLRKITRRIEVPNESDTPTENLTKSLAKGDFEQAKEEIEQLKEQLATLKSDQDKEMAEKLSKQLNELAKQIEKAAENKQLQQQLEQAGIKKEDVERMLENLKKEDLEQLKKQLEEKGMSQQQMQKLAEQLKQQQQAGSQAKQLSQAMKEGAKCNNPGQMGEAMAGLSQAADQLSQLEQMEQEAQQMESTLQQLQNAKDNLNKPCSQCNGSGQKGDKPCSSCKGGGQEQGDKGGDSEGGAGGGPGRQMGQGRGGRVTTEQTQVDFKTERQTVHTHKGAIIGQVLFEGEQVKGEARKNLVQVFTAAERDASDLVNRDRVARQYHKAVRGYFSNVAAQISGKPKTDESPNPNDATDSVPDRDAAKPVDGEPKKE